MYLFYILIAPWLHARATFIILFLLELSPSLSLYLSVSTKRPLFFFAKIQNERSYRIHLLDKIFARDPIFLYIYGVTCYRKLRTLLVLMVRITANFPRRNPAHDFERYHFNILLFKNLIIRISFERPVLFAVYPLLSPTWLKTNLFRLYSR